MITYEELKQRGNTERRTVRVLSEHGAIRFEYAVDINASNRCIRGWVIGLPQNVKDDSKIVMAAMDRVDANIRNLAMLGQFNSINSRMDNDFIIDEVAFSDGKDNNCNILIII